jgi:hypothetical protein
MTFHAMADGDEVKAPLELVVEIGLRERLLGPREHMMRQRDLVDRVGHLVLDRREGTQIGDERVQVAGSEDRIERRRHDFGNLVAIWMLARQQQRLDLIVSPVADAGFLGHDRVHKIIAALHCRRLCQRVSRHGQSREKSQNYTALRKVLSLRAWSYAGFWVTRLIKRRGEPAFQ